MVTTGRSRVITMTMGGLNEAMPVTNPLYKTHNQS